MNKYFAYIWVVAKNTFSTRKKLFAQMINHLVFLIFVFYLYKNVYLLSPNVSLKIPLTNTIWSMAMYYVVFWLGLRLLHNLFRNDIKTGNVEVYLTKPMGYITQKLLTVIGEGLLPFTFALLTSIVVPYLLVGWPVINTNPIIFVISVIGIFILSQILNAFIFILSGLTSFWLEDSNPVYLVVSKFIMIFGNSWVPVAFFPLGLRVFAEYSPFGAVNSIAFAMYPNFMDRYLFWVSINLFWIIVLGVLIYFVSKNAFKKLSVNGS